MVCMVRLLCELRSRHAGPNPRLHQPATEEQRVRLQWTRKRNAAVSCFSLPGFVNRGVFIDVSLCGRLFKPSIGLYWLCHPQMTFAPGRPGHRAPVAAAQAQCQGAGRASARQRATRRVLLRSKRRGTAKRLSCVTNSLVQVQTTEEHKTQQTTSVVAQCNLAARAAGGIYNKQLLSQRMLIADKEI